MVENARRLRWLTLAYASTLILLIATADRGALVISWLAAVPAADKIGHFVLMGLLSYLVNTALGGARWHWRRLSVLKGSAVVAALVTIEEISQLWIAYRAFDLADLAADLAGIWFFGHLADRRRGTADQPGVAQ